MERKPPESPRTSASARLLPLLRRELEELTRLNPSDRPLLLPVGAALATGLPILAGAFMGRLADGLVGSLGGLAFLHMPETRLSHRMVQLMAAGFGLTSCFALGALTHLVPGAGIPAVALVTLLVSLLVRFYRLGPPGSLFLSMACAVGAYAPLSPGEIPFHVGLVALGALNAWGLGFLYSLLILRKRPPQPPPEPSRDFDFVVTDTVVVAACVGLSLLLAEALRLERPYWAPVSCLAVIQSASLRATWNRQVQRILGTASGILLTWGLLRLPLDPYGIALTMMALSFVIEVLVVRHYGLAVVFITPLTILMAEAAHFGQSPVDALVRARLVDSALGSLVGFAGGMLIHSPRLRSRLGSALRKLRPRPARAPGG